MKKMIKIVVCMLLLILLSACGNKSIEVSVEDGYITTIVETSAGKSVGDILDEAEIDVNDMDDVKPSSDTVINDGGTVITVIRNCTVKVVSDGKAPVLIEMNGGTVGEALEKAGISLGEHDTVNHDEGMYCKDGLIIDYVHRVAVTLTVDGIEREVVTSAGTVSEMLLENGIELGRNDRVNMDLNDAICEGSSIVIERINIKMVKEVEEIDFDTKTEYSNSLYQGQSSVKSQGVKGEKELTYEVTYADDVEESRKLISEAVTKEPVDEVVIIGTKKKNSDGRTVVSREQVYDCDGSGHGFWIITYSDGSVEYEDF